VNSNELSRPGYVANASDRCFYCKSELYEIAKQKQLELGLAQILNGTNADDVGDHRPGLRAASDASVQSPLLDLGIGKTGVRALARALGLPIWDKPASACLASRIPYGTQVTIERLDQVGAFEAALHVLGFRQVRVRWHEQVARIEVPLPDLERLCAAPMRDQVVAAGKRAGFAYVTIDLAGYRVGSHNEVLPRRALPLIAS
jgi:uncharacterized protein